MKRDGGGLLILPRETLNAYVTIHHANEYVVWLTFNTADATTHIRFVYIQTNNSKVHIDRDPFEYLQHEIEAKGTTWWVNIARNFNAQVRTRASESQIHLPSATDRPNHSAMTHA